MKKTIALVLLMSGLSLSAFAQDKTKEDDVADGTSKDCEMADRSCVAPMVGRRATTEAPHKIEEKGKSLLDRSEQGTSGTAPASGRGTK